jgi:hypothetical protein
MRHASTHELYARLGRDLEASWHVRPSGRRGKSFRCRCGRPIFFRNSLCLACNSPLGFVPQTGELHALDPGPSEGTWRYVDAEGATVLAKRCANLDTPAACNWLVGADEPGAFCIACRLNRTIPNLDDADNRRYWNAIETAKRRLVAQLVSLDLPVASKVDADPRRGLAFDFLRPTPGEPVLTGHASGIVTVNVEEADDVAREKARAALHEPYRTLLGHLRHEVGHYYWERLVAGTRWHEPFRELFGDERADYAAALRANYEQGPPADWRDRHISGYAASHPWEDWAETWAHYLHIVDGLDTALGFGLSAIDLDTTVERFGRDDLYAPDDEHAGRFVFFLNAWFELAYVLNELSRSMGQPDFYPFVVSRPVARKLHFVHLVIREARNG